MSNLIYFLHQAMTDGEPKPIDPALLECQVAFKSLSDEMLEAERNRSTFMKLFVGFRVTANPSDILERLNQSTLRDLLLESGQSLSAQPQPHPRQPDLGLTVGEAPLQKVTISHRYWDDNKIRLVKQDPPEIPPYNVIEYPGERDWTREIGIEIWFGNDRKSVAQQLKVWDSSTHAGEMPSITRTLYSPEYFETGYEGHDHKSRPFRNQEETMSFVDLARELFMKRDLEEGEWEQLQQRMHPNERLLRAIFGGKDEPTVEELRARPADYLAQEERRQLIASVGEPEDTILTTAELKAKRDQQTHEMMKGIVDEKLAPLDKTEKRVIELRYGLTEGSSRTQAEVGREIGKSRWQVGRIEKKARVKLQPAMEKWRQEQAEMEARWNEKFGNLGSTQ